MVSRRFAQQRGSVIQMFLSTAPILGVLCYFLYLAYKRPNLERYNLNDDADDARIVSAWADPQIAMIEMLYVFLGIMSFWFWLLVYILIFVPKRRNLIRRFMNKDVKSMLGNVYYDEYKKKHFWRRWFACCFPQDYAYVKYTLDRRTYERDNFISASFFKNAEQKAKTRRKNKGRTKKKSKNNVEDDFNPEYYDMDENEEVSTPYRNENNSEISPAVRPTDDDDNESEYMSEVVIKRTIRTFFPFDRNQVTIIVLPNKPRSGIPLRDVETDIGTHSGRDRLPSLFIIALFWIIFTMSGAFFLLIQMAKVDDQYENDELGWIIFAIVVAIVVPITTIGLNWLHFLNYKRWLLNQGVVKPIFDKYRTGGNYT